MRSTTSQSGPIIDTLRVSERELHEMLADIAMRETAESSQRAAPNPNSPDARSADLPRMPVHICHAGNCLTYLVKPRDLHSNAIVFLLGSYVHAGAKCFALLRRSDGTPVQLPATVLRSRHIAGRIHETVAVFDRAIVPDQFRFHDGTPLPGAAEHSHR